MTESLIDKKEIINDLFKCNSCSKNPMNPVVTKCGHLFW